MTKTNVHGLQLAVIICMCVPALNGKPPNIVLIVADDLGWNDVGFHNPSMITPNIDKLANEGVKLNQSYVQPVCSPTRHSIMTGYYPFKAGLQHLVIGAGQAVCSPLNMEFFPEILQKAGYKTHVVGKWHLGFCNWNCTATYRGFDSFYGYYNSREDYYTHEQDERRKRGSIVTSKGLDFGSILRILEKYLDFHDDYSVVWDKNGTYSADLYVEKAKSIITNHNKLDPLFLYLPFQNVHEPLQAPAEFEALYPNVKTQGRKTFSGMVTALDSAIGRVVEALKSKGLYEDTIFFFTPDNGGWIPFHGNNWPLRGGKITIFEGGTRVAGFVSGAGLKNKGTTYNGLMHAVDWHPTILDAAGLKADGDIDGISQWSQISQGCESKRTEFVYNLDDVVPPYQGHAAVRVGDYKLIAGYPGHDQGWYPPEGVQNNFTDAEDWFKYVDLDGDYFRFKQRVAVGEEAYYKLFNLANDPTEHHDLSTVMPDKVTELKTVLDKYHQQLVPAKTPPVSPRSNPKLYGNVWTPGWCNEPMT